MSIKTQNSDFLAHLLSCMGTLKKKEEFEFELNTNTKTQNSFKMNVINSIFTSHIKTQFNAKFF
jgi:hypothetical protein